MKNKIYNIILFILITILIVVSILIVIKYSKNQENEKEIIQVVAEVKQQFEQIENTTNENKQTEKKQVNVTYKGYNVVGMIKIPRINIEYPILDKTTDASMEVSITKFWGNNVNDIGNFSMAGHNYLDGTMFGKTKKLEIGDKIEMTDLTGTTIEYQIFDKYVIDPNDVECVKSVDPNTREITLITCTNRMKNRMIIKAREILEKN